jgi:hypothetical protein
MPDPKLALQFQDKDMRSLFRHACKILNEGMDCRDADAAVLVRVKCAEIVFRYLAPSLRELGKADHEGRRISWEEYVKGIRDTERADLPAALPPDGNGEEPN